MYLCRRQLPIFGYIIVRLNNGSPITYCCFSGSKTGNLSVTWLLIVLLQTYGQVTIMFEYIFIRKMGSRS